MSKRLRYVITLAVCAILCNQLVHTYRLYEGVKTHFLRYQNDMITSNIFDFSSKSTKHGDIVSYNSIKKQLIYRINNEITIFHLNANDDVMLITDRSPYDIRDPQLWTLKKFYSFLRSKQDSINITSKLDSINIDKLALQFIIQDSTGKIIDSYPEHLKTLSSSPKYKEPIGYISGDTLYATYNYPYNKFIHATLWPTLFTFFITSLLILCVYNLYQFIRDEKKSRENQKMYIDNIVHDLKRPVENQINICYLLTKMSPDELAKNIQQNRIVLNEMLHSIQRLLLQSTNKNGLLLQVKNFNLKEALEELTKEGRWKVAKNKKINIQVKFISPDPMISGDRDFLFAVFQNFIDNSIKYSDDEVSVRVSCSDLDNKHVQIKFEDNGYGISSKNLKHVFERYNRGDHQGNDNIKGHGQGLHYARMVIIAHGGKIRIESEINKGTTIIVCLPRESKVKNKNKR